VTEETPQGIVKKTFVCQGRMIGKSGKVGIVFQEYESIGDTNIVEQLIGIPGLWPLDKVTRPFQYGLKYRFECSPDGHSVAFGHNEYLGRWSNSEDLLKWRVQDQSVDTLKRKAKLIEEGKDGVDFASLDKHLVDIKRVYNATDSVGKRTIEIMILDFLRKGQLF